jgi:hypothetical protein
MIVRISFALIDTKSTHSPSQSFLLHCCGGTILKGGQNGRHVYITFITYCRQLFFNPSSPSYTSYVSCKSDLPDNPFFSVHFSVGASTAVVGLFWGVVKMWVKLFEFWSSQKRSSKCHVNFLIRKFTWYFDNFFALVKIMARYWC